MVRSTLALASCAANGTHSARSSGGTSHASFQRSSRSSVRVKCNCLICEAAEIAPQAKRERDRLLGLRLYGHCPVWRFPTGNTHALWGILMTCLTVGFRGDYVTASRFHRKDTGTLIPAGRPPPQPVGWPSCAGIPNRNQRTELNEPPARFTRCGHSVRENPRIGRHGKCGAPGRWPSHGHTRETLLGECRWVLEPGVTRFAPTGAYGLSRRSHRHRNEDPATLARADSTLRPYSGIGDQRPITRVHNLYGTTTIGSSYGR